MKISDAIHKYGWDVNTFFSALGDGLPNMDASVFFVDSTAAQTLDANDAEHGNTWDKPFATIDYAIGKCTASAGDIILVAPGHSESKAATGTLVTCDVAGVSIIGIGNGTIRPTIALSGHTGAVAFSITAASVKIKNILITNAIDALAKAIYVTGTDCVLEDIEIRDLANTTEVAIGILTAATADRLTINRYKHSGFLDGNACTQAISLVGVDEGTITNSWFRGVFSTSAIQMVTTACSGIRVDGCIFENGTQALTKDVVDNATSKWSATKCWDVVGGYFVSGGSGSALAADDVSTIASYGIKIDGASLAVAPTAGSLATFIASGGTSLGTALPASTSLYDVVKSLYKTAAGTDVYPSGVTNDSIIAMILSKSAEAAASSYNNTTDSLEAISDAITSQNTGIGTKLYITKAVTQSTIVAAGAALTGASSGGALKLVDVIIQNDATAVDSAGHGAVVELYSNNASGSASFATYAQAKIGANAVCGLVAATSNLGGLVLESGKVISVKATTEDVTSAGTTTFYLVFERMAAGATIAAA